MTGISEKLPSLDTYKLFIFDLDGTLYDQRKLKRIIFLRLFFNILTLRNSIKDIRIILEFRKQREKHKGYASSDLEKEQYHWCAEALDLKVQKVRKVVEPLMFKLPLKHLHKARYRNTDILFSLLRQKGIKTAIYSDYPVKEKMDALGLSADLYIHSMEKDISQLKPNEKAIKYICSRLNMNIGETIFIGDRDDTDGETARLSEIRFLKLNTDLARNGIYYKEIINKLSSGHE